MTMKITIENEDTGRTATATQENFNLGETTPASKHTLTIGPGGKASFYIHASNRIIVTEDPAATIPKP